MSLLFPFVLAAAALSHGPFEMLPEPTGPINCPKPEDVREQYERQLKDLQEAYGEAMLEIRARKKLASLLGKDES